MWVFLAGDAMGFGTLLAAYGAMRAGSADWPNPAEVLGIQLTALMTFLLICLSVTMVKALENIKAAQHAARQDVHPAHRSLRRRDLRGQAPTRSSSGRI